MLTPETCRAARGLVDWSQRQLANAADVSVGTVKSFEAQQRLPVTNNLAAIRKALERAGVEFIKENGGAVGVKLRQPKLELGNPQFPTKRSFARNFSVSGVYRNHRFTIWVPVGLLQTTVLNAPDDPYDHDGLVKAFAQNLRSIALCAEIAVNAGRADSNGHVVLEASDFPEL